MGVAYKLKKFFFLFSDISNQLPSFEVTLSTIEMFEGSGTLYARIETEPIGIIISIIIIFIKIQNILNF